jgi:hypothetical protein
MGKKPMIYVIYLHIVKENNDIMRERERDGEREGEKNRKLML